MKKKTKLKGGISLILEWIKKQFFFFFESYDVKSTKILLYTDEKI
jgi:hypothetical protein